MPELDLNAIEARAHAATPGPWRLGTYNVWQTDSTRWIADTDWESRLGHSRPGFERDEDNANAEFIAHAREDIPALVALVRRLQGIEAAAREVAAVDGHWGMTDAQIADDMDWRGSEAHIPVEVSRPAFVALLRALIGSGDEVAHG